MFTGTTDSYLDTTQDIEFIDITEAIRRRVNESHISNGIVSVFTPHTTCSVRINESEKNLLQDFKAFLHKIAPRGDEYGHNRLTLDDRPNAHSHILSLFMNTSETIPVREGNLCLGRWQRVFFVELDGPRKNRRFLVHILGE